MQPKVRRGVDVPIFPIFPHFPIFLVKHSAYLYNEKPWKMKKS